MKTTFIFLILITISTPLIAQSIKEKTEIIIENSFNGGITFSLEKYDLPVKIKKEIEYKGQQKFFKDFVYLYKIQKNNKLTGYAILDNVYGKSLPITFLVVFNSKGDIISSEVVKYREPYGGAVRNENWNEQFEGKNYTSGFEVGKDINGISGATISTNSVSKGIKKLALLIEYIKQNK